jgi:hypothetical protein
MNESWRKRAKRVPISPCTRPGRIKPDENELKLARWNRMNESLKKKCETLSKAIWTRTTRSGRMRAEENKLELARQNELNKSKIKRAKRVQISPPKRNELSLKNPQNEFRISPPNRKCLDWRNRKTRPNYSPPNRKRLVTIGETAKRVQIRPPKWKRLEFRCYPHLSTSPKIRLTPKNCNGTSETGFDM